MKFIQPQFKQLIQDVNTAKENIYVAPSIVYLPLKAQGAQQPNIKASQGQSQAVKNSIQDLFEVRDNLVKDLQRDPQHQQVEYAAKLRQLLQRYILMINFLSVNKIEGAEFGWKDSLFGDPKLGKRSTYKTLNYYADASHLGMCISFYHVQLAKILVAEGIQEGLAQKQLIEAKNLLVNALEILEYCRVYFVPKSGSQYSMDIQQQTFGFLINMIVGDSESILVQQLLELKATPEKVSSVAFAAADNYEEALRNFKMTLKQELQVKSSRNASSFKVALQDKYTNYLCYKYNSMKAAGYAYKGLDQVNKQQDPGDAVRFGQEAVRLLNTSSQFSQKYDKSDPSTKPDSHLQLDKVLKFHINYAATKCDKDNKSIFYQKVPESLPMIQKAQPIYDINANDFENQVQELSRNFALPNIEQIMIQEQQQMVQNQPPLNGQQQQFQTNQQNNQQPQFQQHQHQTPFQQPQQQSPYQNAPQNPQPPQNFNQQQTNPYQQQQYSQQQNYSNQSPYQKPPQSQQYQQQGGYQPQMQPSQPPMQQGYSSTGQNQGSYPSSGQGANSQLGVPQNPNQQNGAQTQIQSSFPTPGGPNNDANNINPQNEYAKPEKASCNCFGGGKSKAKKQGKQTKSQEKQKQDLNTKEMELEQDGMSKQNFITHV